MSKSRIGVHGGRARMSFLMPATHSHAKIVDPATPDDPEAAARARARQLAQHTAGATSQRLCALRLAVPR